MGARSLSGCDNPHGTSIVSMPDPIANLLQVAELVQDHGRPELSEWFRDCLQHYLDGVDLAEAFGLKGEPCRRRASSEYLRQQRDHHLAIAGKVVARGRGPTAAADTLAKEIRYFQRSIWKMWRDRPEPPETASALRSALFMARKHGELPESSRALFEIIRPQFMK